MAAFGMAARRWYLLIPLVAASGGVAWLAYTQMPASYTATAAYQVSTSSASEAKSAARSRGLALASPRTPPDPLAVAKSAAADLVESVHPQPPAGSVPGRSTALPVTIQLQQGTPVITVRATANSAGHARDAVTTTTTQLADRLRRIADEQRSLANSELTLDAVTAVAYQPAQRSVGRRVGVATLLFCLALSVLLAAAVERSARHRRLLAAQTTRAEDGSPVVDTELGEESQAGSVPGAGDSGPERTLGPMRAVAAAGEAVPEYTLGPVRAVTSVRAAPAVRDEASEDDTAVIFPGPTPERDRRSQRASTPPRTPAAEPPPPHIPPPPSRAPAPPSTSRPGRPLQQGGRAPMPPRMPRDTELSLPAALAARGNRRPSGGAMPPGPPRRPDPRPESSMREPRPSEPSRPSEPLRSGDRRDQHILYGGPLKSFAQPVTPFDGSDLDPLDSGPLDSGSLDSGPLDSGPLDAGFLVPASLDSVSSDPASFDSSALWLPVADLPVETDGWLPSLAPDDETPPAPGSGEVPDGDPEMLPGELPPIPYREDHPPMADLSGPESTTVMPALSEPETFEREVVEPDSAEAHDARFESSASGSRDCRDLYTGAADIDDAESGVAEMGVAEMGDADTGVADSGVADTGDAGWDDEPSGESVQEHADHVESAAATPDAATPDAATPDAATPADESSANEFSRGGPSDGESPAVPSTEPGSPEHPGPGHPGTELPSPERSRVATPKQAAPADDERGGLEGWPDFDEQVRV